MTTVYKKSLKGVEEVALRSKGLQLRLRAYLILVDGTKSTEMIQALNPSLPEVEMVLSALHDEGYVEIVNENQSANANNQSNQSFSDNMQPIANQFRNTQSFQQPNNFSPSNNQNNNQSGGNNNDNFGNNQFTQARDNMTREIMILLGKDAEMVVTKIQRCESGMDLFAMMMGLKKIITMYANSDKAEAFASKFSYVSTL